VSTLQDARSTAAAAARSRSFQWLARSGFVARGLIYGLIGVLAVAVAAGHGGKTTNQQGALETIARQPLGTVLLVLVAVGLAGYALWRLVRAAVGSGPESGRDGALDRVAGLASGLVYAGLCAVAVEILLGSHEQGSAQHEAGGVLAWPAGTWLVGAAGAVLVGVGLFQGYRGVTADFLEDSKTEEMSPAARRVVTVSGRVGHFARMVVFGLSGAFLVKAAAEYDPKAAIGLDGALEKLARQPHGTALLGVVAAGLVAFALYSLTDARYRRL
jgi:hypothetical protein